MSSSVHSVALLLLVCSSCASTAGEANAGGPEPPPGPLEPEHQGEFVPSGDETTRAPPHRASDAGVLVRDAGVE